MIWELKQLEERVRQAHGDPYADKIHQPLQSFYWKSMMAYYHASEAEKVLNDGIFNSPGVTTDDSETYAAVKAIFVAAYPDDDSIHLRNARFKAESHIIASAQALHSLADILSHIIYWTYQLDADTNSLKINRLNLHSILRAIHGVSQYANTATLIQNVIDAPEFAYLSAFVNTTKHVSLVGASISADFEEDRGGMRIKAFSYTNQVGRTHSFEKKWARDFLFLENRAIQLGLVEVGKSLNDQFEH